MHFNVFVINVDYIVGFVFSLISGTYFGKLSDFILGVFVCPLLGPLLGVCFNQCPSDFGPSVSSMLDMFFGQFWGP